jgi:hypothetical protein
MASRRQDLRLLNQRSKQIQSPEGLGSAARSLLDYTTGIPSLVKTIQGMRAQRGNVQAEVQPRNVLPLVAGLGPYGEEGGTRIEATVDRIFAGKAPRTTAVKNSVGAVVRGVATVGALPASIGLAGYEFATMHPDPTFMSRRPAPASPYVHTPGQIAGQRAKDAALLSGFKTDVGRLLIDGRVSTADAHEALTWANNTNMQEVRNGRQALHDRYKPPRGGWAPPVAP